MHTFSTSPLAAIEARLRPLLPPDLYAAVWVDTTPSNLDKVFQHLRTLQRVLHNYVPRRVSETPPSPGAIRYGWQEGTLMFTDLAGFTSLLEANATYGQAGAEALLGVLNSYFAQMIEIISKSGGDLLEFTGDAMLAQFPADPRRGDVAQAVRAGLRMQRAMASFASIATPQGTLSLGMRIGIHSGRYLTADIGTPCRMEHVLLGTTVQRTKQSESVGRVTRVSLSPEAYAHVHDLFSFEPGNADHWLVIDDLSDEQLGEYDITAGRRRAATALLLDRSIEGLITEIEEAVRLIEPLASYLPPPILSLLVQSAARRQIAPRFPELTVIFVSLNGLSEAVDRATNEESELVSSFSRIFALINAAVEARGGVLKNVTYHLVGSDMLIYFGVPNAHTDDSQRAAATALAIRELITSMEPLRVAGSEIKVSCEIGIARGPAFVAEIGEPRGRREFNVLGDTVNTAARLMSRAHTNQILITELVHREVAGRFADVELGSFSLKGKAAATSVFALDHPHGTP